MSGVVPADERVAWLLVDASTELLRAMALFPAFHSSHEGLAVIWEEFEELKKHVWENTGSTSRAMDEAIQLAAMALRYVYDLAECGPERPLEYGRDR
jgi:hypothetical protein